MTGFVSKKMMARDRFNDEKERSTRRTNELIREHE